MSIYDWSLVPPEFDVVAMNESGKVWMYRSHISPQLDVLPGAESDYVFHPGYPSYVLYPAYVPYPGPKPDVNWEESLEMREESE